MEKKDIFIQDTSLSVKINGKETEFAPYIISVVTETEFHRLATAEIALNDGGFNDEDFVIGDSDNFLIGKEISISVGKEEEQKCIFKGIIEMQHLQLSSDGARLTIEAKHPAYKMTLERKIRNFEDCSDQKVIKDICSAYNIQVEVEDTSIQHERIVQYNCTDWDFINMRAESVGMVVVTTPEGIKIKSPEVNAEPALNIANGYNLYNLDLELDGRYAHKSYKTTGWNYSTQEKEEETLQGGQCGYAMGNLPIEKLAEANDRNELSQPTLGYMEVRDAMIAYHKMLSMRTDLARIIGSAEIWGEALEPGQMVAFENIGKRFDGKIIVSSVSHTIENGDWHTKITLGMDKTLYAERYDNIEAKPAEGMMPSVHGLQIAKVVALEGDPLGEERISIKLLVNENTIIWARLAMLGAGKERGVVFYPEIDDELIVGFVDDNPNNAVVLGMLHSSTLPSPIEKSDSNHQKGIISREKLKILFDDDQKVLTLDTPGNNRITLSDADGGIYIQDQNGNKISLDSNGISMETNQAINLKASQGISIEGSNVNIKANSQLKLQGTAACELSASGNTIVKGAIVQIN